MANFYDDVNKLAEDLKQTPEYQALEKAIDEVKNSPENLKLYQRMDALQRKIMAARQAGQPMTDEMKKEYEEVNKAVSDSDLLKKMINEEQKLYKIIGDIQQAVTKSVGELYEELSENKK
ncbi:YlbF family regulator [Lactobacillus sp. PV034]|uniref:YlbF family regulator n=1 Tax=Lactobacillus sp. PV034 TaxID=2594495 RepID=UPI00223F7099|nr:YlbF family regulator [Lactobacillus sp. PV034]QNQ80099.1 YlbF family regulator [Lactobacillus sp. PV034]